MEAQQPENQIDVLNDMEPGQEGQQMCVFAGPRIPRLLRATHVLQELPLRPWENVKKVAAGRQKQQAIEKQLEEDFAHGIGPSKKPKSLSKTAKRASKSVQIHAWRPPGSPKTREGCPGPEKIEFWRLGTSKIMPKELQI